MTEIIRIPPRDVKQGDVLVDSTSPETKAVWTALEDARMRRHIDHGDVVTCFVQYEQDGGTGTREWLLRGLSREYRLPVLRA